LAGLMSQNTAASLGRTENGFDSPVVLLGNGEACTIPDGGNVFSQRPAGSTRHILDWEQI
jgi:hypothetical protein